MLDLGENRNKIFWINIYAFFLSFQYASIIYSTSTFLAGIIKEENIWIIYSIGALLAILLNFAATPLLRLVNINKFFSTIIILAIINVFLLYSSTGPITLSIEFISFYALSALLFMLSSTTLEEFSRNSSTGSVRGIYNATMSSAYLLAPFISSFFILQFGIKSIFLMSTFFGIISFIIFYNFVRKIKEVNIPKKALVEGLKKVLNNGDLRNITLAQVGLQAFFISMIIYLPFKLIDLGITLTQYLSVLLPVALSPFLFMPPLLGILEDRMKNEKEILIISYLGLIVGLILIALVQSTSLLVWAAIMFFARLCASSAEISTNSYLYKKINSKDVAIISFFISCDYFATLFFTPLFSFLVFWTDIQTLFLTVSFLLCFMLVLIGKLHDTKNYEKHQKFQKEWKEIWNRSKKRTT